MPFTMKSAAAAAAALALLEEAAASKDGTSVTPIQKVLQMMEDMKAKGIAAKKQEEVDFAAFSQFCTDTDAEKKKSVEKLGLEIEKLAAEIMEAEEEVSSLGKKIAELEEDIGRWEQDGKAALTVREKEKADFIATQQEYVATIDAVERSVEVIKSLPGKVPQALLQLSRNSQKNEVRATVQGFLKEAAPAKVPGAIVEEVPEAYAYEGQSGGVLKMLGELLTRFKGELTDLEKEEMSAKHAYDTLAQKLRDETALATQAVERHSKLQAQRKEDAAVATGQKKESEDLKENEIKYMADLGVLCKQKSQDFESRQNLRAGEIEALNKAIEIIGSDSVASERLPGGASASSFAQLRASRDAGAQGPKLKQAAALLASRAQSTGSQTLAMIAKRAAEDPFGKVKTMIRDLLVKLREEANEEANHKGWCDAELATNKLTRENKAAAVEQLTAEVEKMTAESARLAQEVSDLTEEVAGIDKAIATATEDRQAESKENAAAIADAQESRNAVAEALAVLRDFYAKAGTAVAFVQQKQSPAEDAPVTFDSPYQGMQAESGGVIGMLEVIESDFARLETETDAAESAAEQQFKEFMADSEKNKAVAEATVEHHSNQRDDIEQNLASTKRSLESEQDALSAADSYYNKLQPTCVESGVTYQERVKRRQEELDSLKDAYTILSGGEELPSLQAMKAEQLEVVGTGQY